MEEIILEMWIYLEKDTGFLINLIYIGSFLCPTIQLPSPMLHHLIKSSFSLKFYFETSSLQIQGGRGADPKDPNVYLFKMLSRLLTRF